MSTVTQPTNPIMGMSPKFQQMVKDVEARLEAAGEAREGKGNRFLDRREHHIIVRDDGMVYGTCLVGGDTVWISAATYDAILDDEDADWQFSIDLEEGVVGMKYMLEEAPYKGLQARAPKRDMQLDPLTQLERDANALLVSVASAAGEFSDLRLRLFAERLADVQGRRAALLEQLDRAHEMAELAAVALVDANS